MAIYALLDPFEPDGDKIQYAKCTANLEGTKGDQ